MPNSFSRFLTDEDLAQVRRQYLEALAAVELDEHEDGAQDDPPAEPSVESY